jgi:cytochrome c biogenesis protein CcdA
MAGEQLAVLTAIWLGILTSISPCPLATNIAAISYVGRHLGRPRTTLAAGLLYTMGRALTYAVLGGAVVWGLMSMVDVAGFLQGTFHRLLGPLLIVAGLLLLGLVRLSLPGRGVSEGLTRRVERLGPWGAGLLGILFALSFCPVSAALFFGTLIPLATDRGSPLLLPLLYGLGTALPVVGFAILIAVGTNRLAVALDRLQSFELVARRLTAAVFILVGIYETLRSTLYLI